MTNPNARARAIAERCRDYAVMIERAPVHDDMGLSLTHSQVADVLREAADFVAVALHAAHHAGKVEAQSELHDVLDKAGILRCDNLFLRLEELVVQRDRARAEEHKGQ
jgi:hypothetical protein